MSKKGLAPPRLPGSLQAKILSGYALLGILVMGIIVAVWYEKKVFEEAEKEERELLEQRRLTNETFKGLIRLFLDNDRAILWERSDMKEYDRKETQMFKAISRLRERYTAPAQLARIDTVMRLLRDKRRQINSLMNAPTTVSRVDSLLADRLPELEKQASSRIVTVTGTTEARDSKGQKKNIFSWLKRGKEEDRRESVSTEITTRPDARYLQALKRFGKDVHVALEEQERLFKALSDSLEVRNRVLDSNILRLVNEFEEEEMLRVVERHRRVSELREQAFLLICGISSVGLLFAVLLYLTIHREIRLRHKYQQELERSNGSNKNLLDMRKRIILTLSHDIRGPLNAISGSAELAMDTRDRKRRNTYLGNILESSRHITRLANSLLDLSRLNEAKETLNPVPFRLRSLLDELAAEYTCLANDKGLFLIKDMRDTDTAVFGDADRIGQIIGNILSNAVKFTKSGEIRFHARYAKGMLTVEISDTGIGMDEATVGRVFHPFERAAPDMDAEGFGLGLSITKGLVKLLEGHISVTSRPGEGSEFTVSLPLPATGSPTERDTAPANERLRLPGRVIVTDDDPIQLRIVTEMLERNGMYCHACTDVKEVVNELRKGNYDLLLTDIQMRGTGGFKLLSLLRLSNIGNSRTILVAAMTARNDENPDCYSDAGFIGCIRKPFSMNELLHFLSSIWKGNEGNTIATADFDALILRTGDRKWTLDTFIKESEANRKELQKLLQHMDLERLEDTLHRMFPTWEQLGIAHELEAYHAVLQDSKSDESIIRRHTEILCERIHGLITEAESILAGPTRGNDTHDNA